MKSKVIELQILVILCLLCIQSRADSEYVQIQKAIIEASEAYNVSATDLYKIAFVESSLRLNVKPRHNTNGTMDVGVFQINTVHRNSTCKMYNIDVLLGNAKCAARLVAMHSSKQSTDPKWLARYHSKTPSIKARYYAKLVKAEQVLAENVQFLAILD